MHKLRSTTDFSPEEDIDFIERLSPSASPEIHYDVQEKIERYPHLRDRFRYEGKKRGEYSPARSIGIPAQVTQQPMQMPVYPAVPGQQMMPYPPQFAYPPGYGPQMVPQQVDPEKQAIIQTTINPESVFEDQNGKKKRYYIMNTKDNAVFVSMGNKEENSFKIKDFSHVQSVPDEFFNYHGFRECFYGQNPALIFITEEQYRQRKEIVFRRQEAERMRQEEIKERVNERGGHAHSRDEGSYGDPYADYSRSNTNVGGGKMVNGVFLYDDGAMPLPSNNSPIAEEMDISSTQKGLSEILQMARGGEMAVNDDGLMSTEDLSSILSSIE